jgi:hypothetical protein
MAFSNPRNLFYIRLYAFILMGSGLLLALFISKWGSLNCDRTTARCQLKSGSLLHSEQRTFPIQALKGATIDTIISRNRQGYEIGQLDRVLLLPDRTPLMENHWGGEEPRQIARQIDIFVKNPQQQSLQVSQDERWKGILGGIVLNIVGILLLKRCGES